MKRELWSAEHELFREQFRRFAMRYVVARPAPG